MMSRDDDGGDVLEHGGDEDLVLIVALVLAARVYGRAWRSGRVLSLTGMGTKCSQERRDDGDGDGEVRDDDPFWHALSRLVHYHSVSAFPCCFRRHP